MSGTPPTPTPNSEPAAPAAPAATPAVVPAASAPALLGAEPVVAPAAAAPVMPEAFEGGADAWGKLDDAGKTAVLTAATDKAKGESAARTDAFTAAVGKDAKLAAYNALNAEEKAAAFKGLSDDARKELGVTDPSRPTYTDFKLPTGMTLDAESMKGATELFADTGLSQEQAQKFIDLATSREVAAAQRVTQTFVDMQSKWQGEVLADPEIGGPKWEASKAAADRLMDRLNIPGFREALVFTGAGNNPAIVKGLVRLGQMAAEDRLRTGAEAPSADQARTPNYYGEGGPKGPVA